MRNRIKNKAGETIRPNPLYSHPEFMTDPVFIVGNGNSRKDFDLERLKGIGTIIGCNALYRDFSPDLLCVMDCGILKEIQEYAKKHFCLTLKPKTYNIKHIVEWKVSKVNSSGCLAIKLVSLLIRPSICYMLGMDGGRGNIYNNTKNYLKNEKRDLDKVFKSNIQAVKEGEETKFININTENTWPINIVEFMTYTEFERILNESNN
jgi:hypothetical protein